MISDLTVGFAFTGSFCTMVGAIDQMETLVNMGANVVPIVSYSVANMDTRFGKAADFINRIESVCGKRVISTIPDAEPIGPKKLLDILVVMPCTGNTLAKLYAGITDTPVTLACKAHLRNGRPLLLSVATNDGMSMSAKNIGGLLNVKNVYFLPMTLDDPIKKPTSIVAEQSNLIPAIEAAMEGKNLNV